MRRSGQASDQAQHLRKRIAALDDPARHCSKALVHLACVWQSLIPFVGHKTDTSLVSVEADLPQPSIMKQMMHGGLIKMVRKVIDLCLILSQPIVRRGHMAEMGVDCSGVCFQAVCYVCDSNMGQKTTPWSACVYDKVGFY